MYTLSLFISQTLPSPPALLNPPTVFPWQRSTNNKRTVPLTVHCLGRSFLTVFAFLKDIRTKNTLFKHAGVYMVSPY